LSTTTHWARLVPVAETETATKAVLMYLFAGGWDILGWLQPQGIVSQRSQSS